MNPAISIIMPTYNRGYLISKTIQSLQAQNFSAWELIVVDDGSTDDTNFVISQFADDSRIKYFSKENQGAAMARNFGLQKATTSLVGYVDSDDPVGPNFIDTSVNIFATDSNCQFAICNHEKSIELFDKNQKLIDVLKPEPAATGNLSLADLYQWKFKTSGTGIFHRWPLIKGIRWRDSLKLLEDFEFLLQLAAAYPQGFRFIPEMLFRYSQRYGGDGACSNASYLDFSQAFGQLYQLHKNDALMVAEVFTKRVEQYKKLSEESTRGEIPPPYLKYFPNAKI